MFISIPISVVATALPLIEPMPQLSDGSITPLALLAVVLLVAGIMCIIASICLRLRAKDK